MIPKSSKKDKTLEQKLKRVAGKPMTKEEVRRQRVSFVYGNWPIRDSITREEVEKMLDRYDGQ